MKKLIILLVAVRLCAGEYEEGLTLYHDGNYPSAVIHLTKAANDGNEYAQYVLGKMYEEGLGVDVNISQAMYWYKQSASTFKTPTSPSSLAAEEQKHLYQIDPKSDDEMRQYIFQYLDMPKDVDERETMMSKIFSNFGLLPYEKMFLIPVAYTTENYEKRDPIHYPGYGEFNNNIETEFQISLKKTLSYNLLGLNETFAFGYTQEVWWQFYSESAPFRETNYRPEIWLSLPIHDSLLSDIYLKALKFGFWHESNGMGKPLSREWNQFYMDAIFYNGNLITTLRLWYPDAGEDNEDITDYLGYGHLKLSYIIGKHQFDLTWRNNLRFGGENRGSIEAEWSYPIGQSKSSFWYLKAFNGYGASLVDYNHEQNRIGFGFLFSR